MDQPLEIEDPDLAKCSGSGSATLLIFVTPKFRKGISQNAKASVTLIVWILIETKRVWESKIKREVFFK